MHRYKPHMHITTQIYLNFEIRSRFCLEDCEFGTDFTNIKPQTNVQQIKHGHTLKIKIIVIVDILFKKI